MMEQVVSCRDDIAQQYLMLCVIQGFPDECHLRTLPALLAALPELQPGVRVHLILGSLLDRLARCARSTANDRHSIAARAPSAGAAARHVHAALHGPPAQPPGGAGAAGLSSVVRVWNSLSRRARRQPLPWHFAGTACAKPGRRCHDSSWLAQTRGACI